MDSGLLVLSCPRICAPKAARQQCARVQRAAQAVQARAWHAAAARARSSETVCAQCA